MDTSLLEQHLRELETLLDVSRQVTSTLELKPLLGLVLDQLKTVMAYDAASIFVLNGDMMECRAYRGPFPEADALQIRYSAHNDIDQRVMTTQRPIIIPDLHGDTPIADYFRSLAGDEMNTLYPLIHTWMRLPLVARGQALGVLTLHHREPNYYTAQHAELALAFSHQVAIAIGNARLFANVEQRTSELTALLNVTRSVTSTLELKPLLGLILDQLQQIVGYRLAALCSLEGDMVVLLEQRGSVEPIVPLRESVRGHPNTYKMLQGGQPIIIPDLNADTYSAGRVRGNIANYGKQAVYADSVSWMSVPLIARDHPIGLLELTHTELNYYTPARAELVLAFAHYAAIALDNARLFAAEQRRAEQFRVISELSYRITAILDVNELVTQTARLIRETFGYYHVHIGFIEGEVITFQPAAGLWRDEPHCLCCAPIRLRVGQDGVSGHVAASGHPILVPDVARDPRFIPLIPNQTGSELVLPLQVKGNVIGVLDVESEDFNAFTPTDVAVLQSFANQTAVAIENARLYQQAQQLAALEERQKLARELHDSVSQALYGIALGARTARTQLERDPSKATEPLDYVLSLADAGLTEMRALIFELRPESLQTEGLVTALTKQAEAVRVRHKLAVRTTFGPEPDIPLEVKEAFYRIAQEALHNIAKHARASRVELSLRVEMGVVLMEITDNGVGFDPQGDYPGHLGLRSMHERAERLGGEFALKSTLGQGTYLRVGISV